MPGADGWLERTDAGVEEAARTTAPYAFATMLVKRAQARLTIGETAVAAADVEEAAVLAARSDAVVGWFIDTIRADIDLVRGRAQAAADGYLRSLEAAAARGDALQVSFDLHGVAAALATAGRHADALEVSGSAG